MTILGMKHQIILHCLKAASSWYYYPGILSKHSTKKLSFQILLGCITEREKLFLQNLDDTWILVKRKKKGNTVSVRDCIEGNMCIQIKKILPGKY